MYNYKNCAEKFPAQAQDKKNTDDGTKSTDSKEEEKNNKLTLSPNNKSFLLRFLILLSPPSFSASESSELCFLDMRRGDTIYWSTAINELTDTHSGIL